MKLVSIKNPDRKKKTKVDKVLGIDFGTTNSVISYWNGNDIKFLGGDYILSQFNFIDDQIIIGEGGICSIKRKIGVENEQYIFDDKKFSTHEIIVNIFKHLLKCARRDLNDYNINTAIITVPAYFGENKRSIIKKAAIASGINVIRLISEPIASAMAYNEILKHNNESLKKDRIYIVYDLGGGTFDISILKCMDDMLHVLAINGDNNLGGDDFDQALRELILSNHDELKVVSINEIKKIKERISSDDDNIEYSIFDGKHKGKLKLNKIREVFSPLIERTLILLEKTINELKLSQNEIDSLLLVGGGSSIVFIYDEIIKRFNNIKIINKIGNFKSTQVVSVGAAIYGYSFTSHAKKHTTFIDVTPLSLGIEVYGGLMEVIIPRHSIVPCSQMQIFTNEIEGQTSIKISIYQGERMLIKDNIFLGSLVINNLPPMIPNSLKIAVEFIVNNEGILQVNATDELTGRGQEIAFNANIDHQLIDDMIRDSKVFHDDDLGKYNIINARHTATKLINTLNNLNANSNYYKQSEIDEIFSYIKNNIEKSEDLVEIEFIIKKINDMITKIVGINYNG